MDGPRTPVSRRGSERVSFLLGHDQLLALDRSGLSWLFEAVELYHAISDSSVSLALGRVA